MIGSGCRSDAELSKELAEKYGQDVMTMVGFLDGINESLKEDEPDRRSMSEDTQVNLVFDKELFCIRIWWLPRLTGCMNCRSGKKSSAEEELKAALQVSREIPVQFVNQRKSEEMIHVHVEVARSTRMCCGR